MKTLLYPIRAVSKLTGISIDTLRAWERRYQAVTPQREESRRLYTEADVQRLHLLNAAVEKGHAIGRLAALDNEELQSLILSPTASANGVEPVKSTRPQESVSEEQLAPRSLMEAIQRLDYAKAERELSLLAAVLPLRELVHSVALPLMRQVGKAWHEGRLSLAQEHMTSALLRNLLGALIPLYRRTSQSVKLLFATPSGEHHEFGILVSAMLAAGGGLDVLYLGANLPGEEIVGAARKTAPQVVVLGFIGANGATAGMAELQLVAHQLPAQIEWRSLVARLLGVQEAVVRIPPSRLLGSTACGHLNGARFAFADSSVDKRAFPAFPGRHPAAYRTSSETLRHLRRPVKGRAQTVQILTGSSLFLTSSFARVKPSFSRSSTAPARRARSTQPCAASSTRRGTDALLLQSPTPGDCVAVPARTWSRTRSGQAKRLRLTLH